MDWYTAASRARDPQRTQIFAATVDLWCTYLAAQADLPYLARMLAQGDA
jgi:hypothetical protein